MDSRLLLDYLDARRAAVSATSQMLHRDLCVANPGYYLTLLTDPAATISHKREVLANVLRLPAARDLSRTRIREVVNGLPTPELLAVLDVLPARRINSRRARSLVLELILGHAQLTLLAATHRQRLIRLLKHALGERTWSAVERYLAHPTPTGDAVLTRKLLRHARDTATAREVLCVLAGIPSTPTNPLLAQRLAVRENIDAGAGLPRETLFGLRGIYHPEVPASRIRVLSAVTQDSVRHDGPLTALYKDALLKCGTGSESRDQLATLPAHLQAAVSTLPLIDAHVALVLDLSASAASSGERAYHPAALGLALARILESRVSHVSIHQVGGSVAERAQGRHEDGGADYLVHAVPLPQGVTDLATALLAAAREEPQVMLVITDGYENARPGDAAQVAAGLQQLGHDITIYQIVPLFVAGEHLTQRRLGAPIQTIPVTAEDDVRELLARILLRTREAEPVSPQEELMLLQDLLVAR
jgi:hypothetical protein